MAECRGLIVAATSSGSGKTIVTLGILKALRKLGFRLSSAKAGPDFIDPRFHELICHRSCPNLDSWAMSSECLESLKQDLRRESDLCIIEGVMGLFDGASMGRGSTAELAKKLQLPIILIIDVRRQSQSTAAILKGFESYDPDCKICGVVLNRVASERHENLIRQAISPLGIPILGVLKHNVELELPSRHLGLVQANEHKDLETFADIAGQIVANHIDLDKLTELAVPINGPLDTCSKSLSEFGLPPLGQVIAVARDAAFDFSYPHILEKWKKDGSEIIPFSPLANEPPSPRADAVYIPGGYPELHAGQLSSNTLFLEGLRQSAKNDCLIYGECGGYMVLGKFLTDKRGHKFGMAGLLPVSTSFSSPRLHLGYRRLSHCSPLPWAKHLRGHEFHYASIVDQTTDEGPKTSNSLFEAEDVDGRSLGFIGHCFGRVMGSFSHVIDQEVIDQSSGDFGNRSGYVGEPSRLR